MFNSFRSEAKDEPQNDKETFNQKKRVLILGNGFDLDFGSDTRYSTYARGHFSHDTKSSGNLYRFLKAKYHEIPNKEWYNFENEIEEYVKSIEEHHLSQEMIDADKSDFEQLLTIGPTMNNMGWKTPKDERTDHVSANLLKNPSLFPNPVQLWGRENSMANKVLDFIARNPKYFFKIITFNYTDLSNYLEVAIDKFVDHDDIKTHEIYDTLSIVPIHIEPKEGDVKKAVLGINDSIIVPNGYEFLKKRNQIEKSRRESVIGDIVSADELVIFGHSLGDSDADYFRPLFIDMFSEEPSHERKLTFIMRGDSQRIWDQMSKYSGRNNIMPKKACNSVHFIDTSVIESLYEYRLLFQEDTQMSIRF